MSCIFCDIISNNNNKDLIFETDMCCCFPDIHPEAPVHLLIVPKIHIESLTQIDENNVKFINNIYLSIPEIVNKMNILSYRLVTNTGVDAGQSVKHLHFHILGGRKFAWPPG